MLGKRVKLSGVHFWLPAKCMKCCLDCFLCTKLHQRKLGAQNQIGMQGPVSLFHNFEKHFLSNDTLIKMNNYFYTFEKASNNCM